MKITEVKNIELSGRIPDELYKDNAINILYGAGNNSRGILKELRGKKVKIAWAYDDDHTRWGELFEGIEIINREKLVEYMKSNFCNIIIGSLYIGSIFERLVMIAGQEYCDRIHIFSMMEVIYKNEIDVILANTKSDSILIQLDQTKKLFSDQISWDIYELAKQIVKREAIDYWQSYLKLECKEEQYFLNSFIKWLKNKNILDAGAYTGDTLEKALNLDIEFGCYLCFEANKQNYQLLIQRINGLSSRNIQCFNNALWNEEKDLTLALEGFRTKTMNMNKEAGGEARAMCKAIRLDDYHAIPKVDFVKMDIEGAELNALKGMEKRLVSERPVLAISIYHSMEDMAEIPLFLDDILEEYVFFVRKHALAFSETILYAIPKEHRELF